MNEAVRSSEMLRLAAKYVWWAPPDVVVSEGARRLVASVMEMDTREDASALIECVVTAPFISLFAACCRR